MEQNPSPEDWYAPIPERRPRPWHWVIIAAVVAMLAWETVQRPSAGDGRFRLEAEDRTAYAWGGTDSASFAEVAAFLDANPQVETLVLRDVPGTSDMATNTRIARLIRARGLDTHLEHDSFIASGGVHLFMAGENRTFECGARIGVHSWKDTRGNTPRSLGEDPAEGYMTAFHRDMGVDPEFYAFSRDASPHEAVYFVDEDQAESFNLATRSCERVSWTERWFGWDAT